MTRSRKRKLQRLHGRPTAMRALAASVPTLLAGMSAYAQTTAGGLEEIVVTAQKRTEDLQSVPLSIQAFSTQRLQELNVQKFDDYVRFLPSVSYQTFGPGFASVYMRGVASGGDGNHSGSLPSVGIYLDEQPITTIQGALDVHLYDIQRVEALAGPQGTLYGASSQAGTLRIITNKPDSSAFDASYGLEVNSVDGGDMGYLAEGMVNLPINDRSAVRLVGWYRHDGGYIDNVYRERTYPTSGITANNAGFVEDDYNDADTYGARAALRLDLTDNWTITPQLMAQKQEANGSWAYDTTVGEFELAHGYPETSDDRWVQAALTVEGKVANLDLVYAGSYLKRDVDTESDYSDYSYWYDTLYGYGAYWYDDNGDLIDPSQYIQGEDRYNRYTHELRVSSDADQRFRFVGGLFLQRQEHDIQQRYKIDGLGSQLSVTGWDDTLWLTKQLRVDKDFAVFGEFSFDFTEQLTGTVGARYFESDNSLKGFFGFNDGYVSNPAYGEGYCNSLPETPNTFNGAPCKVFDKTTKEDGVTPRVNLTYKFTDDALVYATYSEGFRPGGINRRGTLPPYEADWLTNYELGWKSTWFDNRLRFNGAIFSQEWDDFQYRAARRQWPDGDQQRRCGADRRHRNGRELGGHRPAGHLGRLRLARLGADGELLRLRQCERQTRDTVGLPERRRRRQSHDGRSGGSEGHAAAGHAGTEGQRDRALRVPGGHVRQLRAGFGDLFRRTSNRPARRGERDHRQHAELHGRRLRGGLRQGRLETRTVRVERVRRTRAGLALRAVRGVGLRRRGLRRAAASAHDRDQVLAGVLVGTAPGRR